MRQHINTYLFLRKTLDYVVLATAFLFTRLYIAGKGDIFFSEFNMLLLLISAVTWTVTGSSVRLYDSYDKTGSFSYEFVSILKTVLLHVCVFTFLFFYCFKFYPYPRTFTLLYGIYLFSGILISKFVVKKLLLHLQTKHPVSKNVLIVGTGETGMNFYDTIRNNDHYGYNCVGFVDDQTNNLINGKYLGTLSDLTHILEDNEIDDVVVALPDRNKEQTARVIADSEKAAKRVRIVADWHHYSNSTMSMNVYGKLPLVNIRTCALDDIGNQRLKRALDIACSIFMFTAFSWLFIIIAILIKISSKGPVLFKQERWGLKNRRITCYKFRSMIVQTSEVDSNGNFLQATKNDSRVTPIGRFLRKTNLDELPQFFNVLMGEMSFVGPRPHATPLHIEARETVEHYMLRQMVKPGITGWAQVNGCRGETRLSGQMKKRVDMDIWYIDNYSFWLDCQIVFQTMMNMIKGDKNAY